MLPLRDGTFLETVVQNYAKSIQYLDPAQWGIIDESDKELMSILAANGFWDLVNGHLESASGGGGGGYGLEEPSVPDFLLSYMKLFDQVCLIALCILMFA
jgi:hypothetical protein